MFSIGQQVVCVEDDWWDVSPAETSPIKGVVYTIREIHVHQDDIGLRFEEIQNPPIEYAAGVLECSFHSDGFRPVRKTNIDIFTAMLAPADGSKVAA